MAGAVEQPGWPALSSCSTAAAARAPAGRGWRKLDRPAAVVAGLGAVTAVVAVANPFKHHLSPPCPFHAATGLWCPLCGGTRAVWAVSHGDLRLMLHANALFPAICVAVAWGWLAWVGRTTGWWRLPVPSGRRFGVLVVAVLVTFTVLRNLPGWGALAPPSAA